MGGPVFSGERSYLPAVSSFQGIKLNALMEIFFSPRLVEKWDLWSSIKAIAAHVFFLWNLQQDMFFFLASEMRNFEVAIAGLGGFITSTQSTMIRHASPLG